MQSAQLPDVKILTSSQDAVLQRRPQNTAHGTGACHTPSASVLPGVRRHLRGRRGGLKDMPEMPLDILFEIFAFLHPRDLLNLSRATRAFRALLISRQSACFWREARQQIDGLPEPPSYLSEPAYANLLFSPHCHRCLKPNVHNVLWTFSVRYCSPCQGVMFVHERENSAFLWEAFQHSSHLYVNSQSISSRWSASKHHRPEIDVIKRKWATLQDDDDKAKFKEERKAFVAECQQFARLALEWQTSCQVQRSVEGDKLKHQRFEAIKSKLREEGFADVLDHMGFADLYRLRKLGPVNRASKLTEKGWNIIRPSIIQYVAPLREKYRQERKDKVFQARLKYLRQALDARQFHNIPRTAASDCEPGFLALATMPAFQTLLQDEPADAETEDIVIQLSLYALVESWTECCRDFFTGVALQGLGEDSAGLKLDVANLLDLAIVHFSCTRCKRRQLRWPHVLAHRCFRTKSTPPSQNAALPSFRVHTRFDHDAQFRGEELAKFDNHLGVARSIIRLTDLHPGTATYADMQDSGARFVCWRCPILTKRTVFDWQAAIQHSTIAHSMDGAQPDIFWERLPFDQAAKAWELEQELLARNSTFASLSQNPVNVFGCARCTWHGDFLNMKRHLEDVHDMWLSRPVEELRLGEDLYLHEDSNPCGAPSVWMYPSAQPLYPEIEEGLRAGRGFLASF